MNFGLYIHWPFCKKKCPYCDFNSYAFEHEPEIWIKGLLQEIEDSAKIFGEHTVCTIFFGGGTPSLIEPKYIKSIIDKVKSCFPHEENLEITLETNPSSVESHSLDSFMENGINRFSIGMQSLKDENLQFLGRLHSAKEAVDILTYASKICPNVSGDFIYALPNDSLSIWKDDLAQIIDLVLRLNLKHCSLYQLTIEQNTAFEQAVYSKKFVPMNEDLQSELYMHTYETLQNLNWDFYEISNAAKMISNEQSDVMIDNHTNLQNVPRGTKNNNMSQEASIIENANIKSPYRSKHNSIYWNYGYYLGVGAGAHSRMPLNNERIKFNNPKNPYKWLEKALGKANNDENKPILNPEINELFHNFDPLQQIFFNNKEDFEELSLSTQIQEKLLMGLRLTDGIVISQEELQFINLGSLDLLIREQFIEFDSNILKLPIKGRLKMNAILKLLFE